MLKNLQQLCSRSCRYFSTQNSYNGALNAAAVDSSALENRSTKRGPKGYTEDGGHIYPGFTYYPRYYIQNNLDEASYFIHLPFQKSLL